MNIKIILILSIVYIILNGNVSENFSDYNTCLNTIAGRMLWKKEKLSIAKKKSIEQNKCSIDIAEQCMNEIKKLKGDCKRYLEDIIKSNKNADNRSGTKWYGQCIYPILK